MIAADTNILVRLVTGDSADQLHRVRMLLEEHKVFVASTVMLEANWVLRSTYEYDRTSTVAALRSIAGLPQVVLEHPDRIERALAWSERGMDFADALHLAAAEGCEAFVTFDRGLVALAGRLDVGRPAREP